MLPWFARASRRTGWETCPTGRTRERELPIRDNFSAISGDHRLDHRLVDAFADEPGRAVAVEGVEPALERLAELRQVLRRIELKLIRLGPGHAFRRLNRHPRIGQPVRDLVDLRPLVPVEEGAVADEYAVMRLAVLRHLVRQRVRLRHL